MNLIRITQAIAASFPLVCSATSLAPGGASMALELSATIHEQVGPAPRCASNFGGTITGEGSSPQLGRFVFIASDCIAPQGPLFVFSEGRLIITTINGEQLTADYSGQFVPTGNGADYVFSSATFQITSGGSGRYALAGGGGTLRGGSNLISGLGNLQLSGRLTVRAQPGTR